MHARRVARDHTLDDLGATGHHTLAGHGIGGGLGVDLDDGDAGVFGPAVVLAVPEVADPGLEFAGVVFPHHVAVRDDGGFAGERGPLAGAVEEGDVDARVRVEVVRLAGFGVGVEEEVESTAFLELSDESERSARVHCFTGSLVSTRCSYGNMRWQGWMFAG